MNCRGCWQRFLPLLDLSRKIEGDSVRRVGFQVLQLKSGGASRNALLHSPRISLWLWKASWYFPNDVGQL